MEVVGEGGIESDVRVENEGGSEDAVEDGVGRGGEVEGGGAEYAVGRERVVDKEGAKGEGDDDKEGQERGQRIRKVSPRQTHVMGIRATQSSRSNCQCWDPWILEGGGKVVASLTVPVRTAGEMRRREDITVSFRTCSCAKAGAAR